MKNLMLALATVGAIGLAASSTPAQSAPLSGLRTLQTEAGPTEVRRRCYHRRYSSGWRCRGIHRRWESRRRW